MNKNWSNLLDNSKDSGTTLFEIDVNLKSDPIQLIIQDNGCGMSPLGLLKMISFGFGNQVIFFPNHHKSFERMPLLNQILLEDMEMDLR